MNKISKLMVFLITGLLIITFCLPVEAAGFSDLTLRGELNRIIKADLDGDGVKELVLTTSLEGYVYVFKLNENKEYVLAEAKFIGSWVNCPAVGSLGEKKQPKLFVADNLNQLIVLDFDGEQLKIVKISPPYKEQIKRIAIGDLDGDELNELVIAFEHSLLVLQSAADDFSPVCEEKMDDDIIKDVLIEQGKILIAFSEKLICLSLKGRVLEEAGLSGGFLQYQEPAMPVSDTIKYGEVFPGEELLTRGEGIALVALAYRLQPKAGNCYFTDLPVDSYLSGLISAAGEKNIVTGYPDGTIRPDQPLSRQEYLLILCRAAKLKGDNMGGSLPYHDWNTTSEWAKSYLRAAWDRGIIDADEGDNFLRPQAQITWGEANNWLLRSLNNQ